MKKILLIAAIVFSTLSVEAQIQKGNVLVGGNFANLSAGLNSSKTFSLTLSPKAAWFVQDNLALGGYADLGILTAKNSSTTTFYGIGALGRYYAGNDANVLKHSRFFGEATVGFAGTNVSGGGGNTNGIGIGIGPGFAYFVTPNIGLETLLKYTGVAGFGNVTYQSNIGLSFGFQIYLPGKSTAEKIKSDIK